MVSGDQRAHPSGDVSGRGLRVAIIHARWNEAIVDRLLEGAHRGLAALGVTDIIVESVPGSFELPFGAAVLARSGALDAVVALGVVIRGETTHYEIVSEGAAQGIQDVQISTGVPIAFGALTVENQAQALARSEGPGGHNVGEEAALVAVDMARLAQRHPPR
jgi:6,7-dimethyl-8-ribityllumazine synthase